MLKKKKSNEGLIYKVHENILQIFPVFALTILYEMLPSTETQDSTFKMNKTLCVISDKQ